MDDPTAYHNINHIAHIDNLISSHDDSAIIKSEIFDPAYDEMHQMLVSSDNDYEHTFLNGVVDTSVVSSLLDGVRPSDNDLNFSSGTLPPPVTTISCESEVNDASALQNTELRDCYDDLTTTVNRNGEQQKAINDVCDSNTTLGSSQPQVKSSSAPTTPTSNSGVSIQATLVSAPGLLPTVPNPVVNINNLNAASMLGGNAPVLTTPVFLAQGTPGPAGQTNSIITTHLARLVPAPDGKGYILHLGLTPQTTTSTANNSTTVSAHTSASGINNKVVNGTNTVVSNHQHSPVTTTLAAISAINNLTQSQQQQQRTSTTLATIASSSSISSVAAHTTSLSVIPASVGGGGGDTNSAALTMKAVSNSINNVVSSQTGLNNNTVASSLSQQIIPSLVNSININNFDGSVVTVSQKSPTTGKPEISICGNLAAAIQQSAASASGGGDTVGDIIAINGDGEVVSSTPSAELTAAGALSLLDNGQPLLEQQQMVQIIHQQLPVRSKSKRRNSKELRELMELEQLSAKHGDTDRFVICSDGPMNCALCGYNTTSYSSFKSHIICSHPCWRITKKLSRNRLLVEKSVKVSVPVANFSVPNPIPAVPIQQRVQSKKNKKENSLGGNGSTKELTGKDTQLRNNKSDCVKKDAKEVVFSTMNLVKKEDVLKDIPVEGGGHDKSHLEGKRQIYKCSKCLRLFVSEEMTVTHIVNSHNVKKPYNSIEVSNDYGKTFNPIYGCNQKSCNFTCETITELDKHKAETHAHQMVFRCQICGYSAESTKAVSEHAMKIHRQQVMMYGLTD